MNRTASIALLLALFAHSRALPADFATEAISATFKLFHPDCTSTCFLVQREDAEGEYYLVTTGHSFTRIRGESALLVLREQQDDGHFKRRDHQIAIRRGDDPLWVRHPKEDIAVLRLGELPVPVRSLSLAAIADEERLKEEELHTCSSIFVLTYPQRFEANDAGFPVARQGIIADHPFLPTQPHHRYLVDFNTFSGDSGGPVFVKAKDGRPLVIGMVLAQFRYDERIKTEFEERIQHHPLGLGTVIYPQFIRETIDLAAQQPEASAAECGDLFSF